MTTFVCPKCGATVSALGATEAWCSGDVRDVLKVHPIRKMKVVKP